MRRVSFIAAVLVLVSSCTGPERLAPSLDQVSDLSVLSLPPVRISEIHYDNAGTDAVRRIIQSLTS